MSVYKQYVLVCTYIYWKRKLVTCYLHLVVMADVEESQFSLLSLEDDLTCSICLSTFVCPVTIPCGHNFCQDCLLLSWKDSYSCPQCRTIFATKPELKKNTVLSTVVETFRERTNKSEASLLGEEKQAEKKDVIRCDACMETEASQTCLTCMASFCDEHLRPHLENPIFRLHQLSKPVGDLSERICPDHHKLMELFCSQHGRPICSMCLQQVHKGCTFVSPEEQRNQKESELRDKLGLLDEKIEKTENIILQMNDMQSKLKDGATKRKTALATVYQQIRDMLAQEERRAQTEVDRELEIGQTRLRDLMKRFTDNAETMRKAREDINSLLSQSQTPAFLQATFDLPKVVKSEPFMPRINLDSKTVTAAQAFSTALKEHLTEILNQPVETRLPIMKPSEGAGEKTAPVSGAASPASTGSQPESETQQPKVRGRKPRSHSSGRPPMRPYFQSVPVPGFMGSQPGWIPPQFFRGPSPNFNMTPPFNAAQWAQQDRMQPGAAGGSRPGARSDFTKKDHPKRHPPSEKSTKSHPQPKKN